MADATNTTVRRRTPPRPPGAGAGRYDAPISHGAGLASLAAPLSALASPRRALFGGLVLAPVAAAAAAAGLFPPEGETPVAPEVGPDAALLALVPELRGVDGFADPLIEEASTLSMAHPRHIEIDGMLKAPMKRRAALWEAIEVLPARTMAGIQAKAQVAPTWFLLDINNRPDPEDALIYGLVQDLLALPGGAA